MKEFERGANCVQNHWNVLIADDEPIIREGIRESVDWQELDMKVVAEAEDGEEAFELAIEYSVDILMVDLNMPIMDGLTLIKHVRESLPNCKIIIISGHDEFTYAQEALRLNVNDYILKPANPDQLQNVLQSIRKQLEEREQQSEYLALAKDQIIKNIPLLQQNFCQEWIKGNMTESEIIKQLKFLHLPLECPNQFGLIQCYEIYINKPLLNENNKQLFNFTEDIVAEALEPFQKVVFRDPSGFISVCIWGNVQEDVVLLLSKKLKNYLNTTPNMHFEQVTGETFAISEIYKHCETMMYENLKISPIVRRARSYLSEHFSETDLTLESLAQYLQVSPVYLSRIMKKELGTSFVSMITNMRISKAIMLLNSTELSILEIAGKVGYDTQHYFSTAFKKVMGVSPNQYRKGAGFSSSISSKE
jgi:two-component system, response regulator YesN